MIPEPTPVSGIEDPNWLLAWLDEVIWTTAGPTFSATCVTAELSLIVSGWLEEVFVPAATLAAGLGVTRFSAPVAPSAASVPPDARTAEIRLAARIVPRPMPLRRRSATTGAVTAGEAGAGSNQRSGVGERSSAAQLDRFHASDRLGSGE